MYSSSSQARLQLSSSYSRKNQQTQKCCDNQNNKGIYTRMASFEQRPSMHARKRSSICIGRPDRRPASIRISSSGSESSTYTAARSSEQLQAGELMPLSLESSADTFRPARHSRTLSCAPTAQTLPLHLSALQPCIEKNETPGPTAAPTRRARPTSMFFSRFANVAQETQPAVATPTASDDRELRILKAQVEELSTRVLAKDLTIEMLTERVDDMSMEMDLLRSKLHLLENTIRGLPTTPPVDVLLHPLEKEVKSLAFSCQQHPMPDSSLRRPSTGARSISTSGDSALGGSFYQAPSVGSAALSRQSSASEYSTPTADRSGMPEGDMFCGDVSFESLQLENEELRMEVSRLNNALEDGLGALAGLSL